MRLAPTLASLPEGTVVVRGRRGWLACEAGARARLLEAGFGPEGGEALPASDLAGRRPLGAIQAGDERWIVRRFHHGGLLRWLGERLFLTPARPFHELRLASALQARGLPTPRVVAARALRGAPFGWRLALVSVRVEGARDGAEILERLRQGALGAAERRRFLEAAGALVGRLHAAGFLHADLHPRNLLAGPGLERLWVLDLDRGRFAPEMGERERRDNLRRLYRAVRRREARGRRFLARTDYLRFLRSYARARGAEPREVRADWRAILVRDRRRAPLHRLGWWLEGLLGSGPEVRDGQAVPRS